MENVSVKDLSETHHLIGDFFPDLAPEEAWERYQLSASQLQHFEEHGFLSGVKLLEDEQVEILRAELEALTDPNHPGHRLFYEFHSNESADPDTVLFHSLGHWRITPGFHDVLWNPRFVVAASQLLGSKAVRFWHDQLFCKPAKHGGVVAWHQDYSYWTRTKPLQHLTCWIGLDDATNENGCLQYIPGSHKWDLLEKIELAGSMDSLKDLLNPAQIEQYENRIAAEMPAGYGTFHHPKMVHGSYENRSDRPRRAFVINVFADGTSSDTDEEMLSGVPVIKKDQKMEGQFFPLLYTPK
jgi:ectoine hydroxylase-related dioxygenase (phytanoyl-CoA dioxygenase family)